jgi:TonB family protein
MPVAFSEVEADSAPVPRLLVELPSWPRVFFGNLNDLILPRQLPPLDLRSAPAPFWNDVFVQRRMPWHGFFRSGACHVTAFVLLVAISRFLALQPKVVPEPAFDHSEVIYYAPSEYLPPIDTRTERAATLQRVEPELSRQPIISLPREADNREQTIVTPAKITLKRDVLIPNIVSWSDAVKPQLEIPPVPLTPAAQITRIAPKMNAVVAPPPSVETSHTRTLGDLNIGHSAVINPAPQLAISEQRAGGRSPALAGMAPQLVAPPSQLSGSAGTPGRVIALNLHPAIAAPPDAPQGNRRGAFPATPQGHADASGSSSLAGITSATGNDNGSGSGGKFAGGVPSGLYVGSAPVKTAPVAGNAGPSANQPARNLTASVHPPRVTSAQPMQPGNYDALTEPERAVFAGRKFYSLTLNLPNLNSAGGSWIIRFAEMKHDADSYRSTEESTADLSQPTATHKIDPGYSMQLMRENVAGTVILYAVIHADGTVGNVRVLRGVDDRLDRSASQAVAQWQFQPATKNGTPVDVEATFQIPFKPARVGSNF